jgi:hypothetical protein
MAYAQSDLVGYIDGNVLSKVKMKDVIVYRNWYARSIECSEIYFLLCVVCSLCVSQC